MWGVAGPPEGRFWPVYDAGRERPLGCSPEEQRSSGRLDMIQDGNLKCTEAGHPYVSKDKLAGKTISLAEQRTLAGIQE